MRWMRALRREAFACVFIQPRLRNLTQQCVRLPVYVSPTLKRSTHTSYLRSVNTGKEIRLEGRWSGIDCAEIKAKCTEYELDSNNITKIKTFNGVTHEAVVL